MSASKEDIYTYGLDMMLLALEAPSRGRATAAVIALVRSLDRETAQRVAVMLAIECMRGVRPRRSRREIRTWIEQRRFAVMVNGLEAGDA